ncbi:Exodeoxyribonuclease 7 small subunit [Koleobacter methoxysyntrophicus]|jgi:exodeoxyribonuclease VII small subunit|uniref:Exodeoxyribonuclease 7 small subunit n=1 Tax=Koleobacter methoxysyntrophicus TaxID=2751313 RepID=A0A8A0RRA6_9FIRM|nr:exodeoxyribonuclease VII small subunit [Koleobacter methoxysyntrophicus]MDI3540781.1 exodeoxyribonuclease small subunit [Thermosediminibacterales bacterium]MDK2901435.1 exodeoxyribonuclease small subunit [Thermosediminibacterales bacterium]QSQ10049.1 Exodeoxyribonuclease 7 small subunit [Koleobacter methoxysyntrophicus]
METDNLTFETALKNLEQVVDLLEKGDLPLEEALKEFEKGVKLARFCTRKLNEVEGKVNLLIEKDGGEFILEEFKISEGE